MNMMQSDQVLERKPRRNARTLATRQSLIAAAEKLIAKKGLADVSTRDILNEAGQRNQSALQYHFGSKDGLIKATIGARTDEMDSRRKQLLDAITGTPSLEALMDAMVRPIAELASEQRDGRNYLIFLAQAVTRPGFDSERTLDGYTSLGMGEVITRVFQALPNLEATERLVRLNMVLDLVVATLKRWASLNCAGRSEEEMISFLVGVGVEIFRRPA